MHPPHLMEDKDLMSLYLRGNEHAFETLFNRHKDRIYTSIYFLVRNNTALAEDLFQETFIKIVTVLKEKRYNEEGKFIAWALRIAHNLVIDYFRIRKNRMRMLYATDEYDPLARVPVNERNAIDEMIHQEKAEAIKNFVEKLPEHQREVIVLRHYGELSFKEISEILGVNINTVLGRAHYGIISMRSMMGLEVKSRSKSVKASTLKSKAKVAKTKATKKSGK